MCDIHNTNVQVNTLRITETSKFTQEITWYWFLILTGRVYLIAQADDNLGCVKDKTWGTRCRSWLRVGESIRKVAGTIPDFWFT